MGRHALLSASGSHRWMNCPPSVRLCEQYEDRGSFYAAEGTCAHKLGEFKLKSALGIPAKDPTDGLTYYSEEMEECTAGYAAYVMELVETAKRTCADPVVLIEQRLDYSRYVQEGFGTGDAVVIADGTLHIVDYKHGRGILVEAKDNPQMKLYALGALELFDGIYDISHVGMTVYQPRRGHISTSTVSRESLYRWADEVLKPAAELAYAGKGEFRCGDWCQFCRAKNECRKRAERSLELARYEFRLPPLLEDGEIESILGRIDGLVTWASDIKDYALQSALSGKRWNGWKLVEGRSSRRYTDDKAVLETVSAAGFDPCEHKVMGITAMERALGKSRFAELLGGLVEKLQGKPTLVPECDKRPAMNTAKIDFSDKEDIFNV